MILDIFEILFAGMCVGLASSVTVGPVAVLCIQRTLSKGMLSGLMSGLGVAFADALLAILAFSVFSLLKSYIDQYYTAIQVCAGIFVIIVGIGIFFKNPVPQIRKNRAGKTFLWQDFASMFGFTLANFVVIIPYILAFFAMFNVDLSTHSADEKQGEKMELVADGAAEAQSADVLVDMPQSDATTEGVAHSVAQPNVTHIIKDGGVAVDEGVTAVGVQDKVVEGTIEGPVEEPKGSDTKKDDPHEGFSSIIYNALIILGFLLGAMVWWVAITAIINLFRRRFRPRHMLTINHIAGVVICVLGIYTLLSVVIK